MRVGVYDRYLSTMGGGERYACGVAAALDELGADVELITDEHVSLDAVGARLRMDLGDVRLRVADIDHEPDVTGLTTAYDLFVNATYLSLTPSFSHRSVLLVNFPEAGLVPRLRWGQRPSWLAGLRRRLPLTAFGTGFRAVDPRSGSLGYWAGRRAVIHLGHDRPSELALLLRLPLRGHTALTHVHVHAPDGALLGRRLVEAGQRTWLTVRVPPDADHLLVEPTGFVPAVARLGEYEPEFIGVIVDAITAADHQPATWTAFHRLRLARAITLRHLDTYDRVLANSSFTAGWVARGWGVPAQVLHPPCDPPVDASPGPRVDRILHVGRFFEPGEAAHHKHQLELVEAYGRLPADVRDRWSLVLVGGVQPGAEAYVERVRRAGQGLNVEVITDAPGDELEQLFLTSRIYWHATGLGVPEERWPERQEHFGITTVEAMSCGLVPVVIGQGGQPEIVREGVDGHLWRSLEELRERTVQLVRDPARLERMSVSSTVRARDFATSSFRSRLEELVGPLLRDGADGDRADHHADTTSGGTA